MPRDVSTRWNSTFDMLEFAIEYQVAIDDISSSKNAGLRQYELSEEEWGIAQQLCNTLKVRSSFPIWHSVCPDLPRPQDIQRRNIVFFLCHSEPGNRYSGDGPYRRDIEHFTQQILLSINLRCTWDSKEDPQPLLQCNR